MLLFLIGLSWGLRVSRQGVVITGFRPAPVLSDVFTLCTFYPRFFGE